MAGKRRKAARSRAGRAMRTQSEYTRRAHADARQGHIWGGGGYNSPEYKRSQRQYMSELKRYHAAGGTKGRKVPAKRARRKAASSSGARRAGRTPLASANWSEQGGVGGLRGIRIPQW